MTSPPNIWRFNPPPPLPPSPPSLSLSTSKGIPRRKRGRPCSTNAARERSRVRTLRLAFLELQKTLPAVPPDTKLSKLDVLVLATTYISHLLQTLNNGNPVEMSHLKGGPSHSKRLPCSKEDDKDNPIFKSDGLFRPVKKWPMRSRLYASIFSSTETTATANKFNKEATNMAAASQTTRT